MFNVLLVVLRQPPNAFEENAIYAALRLGDGIGMVKAIHVCVWQLWQGRVGR